jgi:glyoxylase-like metal-dependent hydrolase (beta-lactamase superfamily II)
MAVTLGAGPAKVHLLRAGETRADAGVAYGIVPKALWSRYEQPDEHNSLPFILRCLLIESGGLRILVDTGHGDKLPAPQRAVAGLHDSPGLIEGLADVGLEPADVDLVIATHLHADHCGGQTTLRGGKLVPRFPNARYLISRGEFDEAMQPNERTRATYLPENYAPLADAGVVDWFDGRTRVTDQVEVVPAPGHTAHHAVVRVTGGDRPIAFTADLAQRPVQLERIAWIAAFDVLPLVSLDTKREFVRQAIAEETVIVLQHDPRIGVMRRTPEGRVAFEVEAI